MDPVPSKYPGRLWFSATCAWLGSLQFGFHLAVLNTCLSFTSKDLKVTEAGGGAVVTSVLLVGAAAGGFFAGQAADALGPRRTLVWNNVPLLAGSCLSALAPDSTLGFWSMLLGRLLAGWGVGTASLVVPRYLAEIAPVAIRGALGTFSQLFVCVGILVAFVIGLPYDGKEATVQLLGYDTAWWRVMFAIGLLPATMQAVGMSFCPESPVWLEWIGKTEDAWRAKGQLQGQVASALPQVSNLGATHCSDVEKRETTAFVEETEEVTQPLRASEEGAVLSEADSSYLEDEDVAGEGGWDDLVQPRYRRMMVLAVSLPLLQQASGINSITFYSSSVFARAGLRSPILGSIVVGCVNVAGTGVAAYLMDRLGRRPLLILSHAGMAISLISISVARFLPLPANVEGYVSLVAILGSVLLFSFGVGPIPWLYISEILPERIKGRAAALCTCLNWLAALVIGLVFPVMLELLDISSSYLVFAALNAGAVVFAYTCMVETKGRSLQRVIHSLLVDHSD
ncbi:hypothetical protein ABBQ32_001758 [Trebouxia sp. C0010 RCD-2024]